LLQAVLTPLGVVGLLALGRGLGAAAAWYVAVQVLAFGAGAAALRAALAERRGEAGRGAWVSASSRATGSAFGRGRLGRGLLSIRQGLRGGALSISELTYYAVPSGVLQRLQMLPSAVPTP